MSYHLRQRQSGKRDPMKGDHSINPQSQHYSLPQLHQHNNEKSQNDEYVPFESPQERGIEETEGATGTWLVVDQSTEQELTATIRQLENEKEELARKKEELEKQNKTLQEAKEEMITLQQKLLSTKAILEKRCRDKDEEYKKQEAIKQQLERELAEAKEKVELVEKRFEMTKNEELKKQLNELEEERNDKLEQLQQKDIKIEQLEKQLSEKDKYIFDMEASAAADQREKERLCKEKENKEMESDKNITDATRRIDELEQKHQEQLKELKEKNEQLRITVLEQEKLTRELSEKDTELEEWHIKVTKLEEEVEHIRIEEEEKRAELVNTIRRELEKENQRKVDKLTSDLQEKMKTRYSDRLKEWQAKFNEVDSKNKKLEDELNETEAKRLSLEDALQESKKQLQESKKQLQDKEQHCTSIQNSLTVKSKAAADLKKQFEEILKQSKEKEKKLLESINLKATELNDLQGKCRLLQQELVEKEQILAKAQMKHHNFQQSHSIVERDLEVSQKRITTLLKKEAELSETIKSLTEEKKKMDKQLKETKQLETDRIKYLEEEVQVLTAQVNAYSRECEKQKGLVAQNQERHKTEIQELNEKLTSEQKSKQQLESQLTTMKKQYDSVSASEESLQKSNQKLANDWTMLREQFDNLTATNNSLCATNERLQQSKQQLESQLTTMKKQYDSISASKESLQQSNQKLVNELNTVKQNSASDQKLVNDLTILRQQVVSLTTSRESLLTAYNQEQAMATSLEQQLQIMSKESAAMKKANEVLKDKVLSLKQQLSSQTAKPVVSSHPNIPPKIGTQHNTVNSAQPTGSNPTQEQQGDGNAEIVLAKGQQVAPPPHAEQPDSVPDDTPLMSKEEMSRLFKWQDQQDDSGRATVTQTPQQVEDSLVKEQRRQELAQRADEALLEVERMRKQPLHRTTLPHASSKQEPVNQRQPKKKIKQQQAAADDSDSDVEENPLIEGIDDEIHEMAEEVRRMSRRPDTQQVLFDDGNSLPYDPNLVCPKCGRQYRVGEIQKLKRHMVEFCSGKR